MSGDVKHDYHLVDPSPWPIVGSIGAFTMLVGRRVLDEQGLYRLLRPAGERPALDLPDRRWRWCSTPWPAGGAT